MKLRKFLVFFFSITIVLLFIMPNVHGNSAKLAYIYYNDPTTASSYNTFLASEGFSINLIDVDFITTGTFDTHDIIIIGPDLGSWSTLYMDETKEAIIDDSNLPIIGLGNGGFAFFGLDGLSLYIGYDNGGSISSITNIDVIEDTHAIFNTPNDLPSGNIQLYSSGSDVYYAPTTSVPDVTLYGKVAGSSIYYCLTQQYDRYFLWGFDNSPSTMTQDGKDLFINLLNYFTPPESGIFGYNILILIGIISISVIILIKKKNHN